MRCPKCGAQISEGVSFCNYCGSPVAQTNTENPADQTVNQNSMNNVNMYQNNIPNQYQTQNNMNNVPNKKTPWGLIIGAIILALAIIAVFVGISMSKEDNNTTNDNNGNNTIEKEDNNTTKEESTTAEYSDYTFTIPSGFNATPSSSQLLITNDKNTIASAIIYQSGTGYDTLASMKDQIVSLLEAQETSSSQNYDFTNAVTEEKTYDGTRFLITSGIAQGTIDLDITYAETQDGVFVVSIAKTNGTITDSDRQTLYSIVASANNNNF